MRRVLTAAVGVPLIVAMVMLGPPWLLVLFVATVGLLALDEYLGLVFSDSGARPGRWFPVAGAAVTASFGLGPDWIVGVLVAAMLVLLSAAAWIGPPLALARLQGGASGLVYVSVFLGFLLLLPRPAVLVLLGIVWAGDTAAFYGGRAFGRRRLAPLLSPGKTVEGAVAGVGASVVAGMALGFGLLGLSYGGMAVVSLLTAAAGQWGDLVESAIKRSAGVKDSGTRLPGHGGFLDRIDSLLVAAPVFHFLLVMIER